LNIARADFGTFCLACLIDTELKAKIEAFKAEKRAAKLAALTAAALDEMDTGGG
jgi:hypothetical protein